MEHVESAFGLNQMSRIIMTVSGVRQIMLIIIHMKVEVSAAGIVQDRSIKH